MVLYICNMKFRLGKYMIAGDVLNEEPCSHVQQKHSRMDSTQISRAVLSL